MAVRLYSTLFLLFIVISSPCLAIYTISDYRLITKDRPNAGIVEIFNQDIGWGLVCDEYWNFNLASIVCSQLNFPGTSLHLTAVSFDDHGDEWPLSVTNYTSTYFTDCSVNGPNMQCETFITECFNVWTGAVSCKEPGYIGCFSDYNSQLLPGRDRVLSNGPHYYYNDLTIDLCINACAEGGYFYAGVEFGIECSCGGQDENIAKHGNASDGECVDVCTGDPFESCGDSNRIAIYQVGLGVCEDPGTPRNGFRYNETGSLRYGNKIYFNCSDGYTLEGPDVIQCVQTYDRRDNVGIGNSTHAVMWNQGLPKCTGFSSTKPSSATTKSRGLTNQMTFSGSTDQEQQSGHDQVIISISIGIVSGLLLIIAIIVVVVICKRHRRRSNIALRQSVCDREGQELDPYTSLDATTMKQPAYEDIKATRHGNRGHANAIEGVEYENQTIVEHPCTSLDATTMEQPAYDDTMATTRGYRGQMNAIEGVEYENQRIVEQTARVKKSNVGVADGNTEPEYELLN